MPQVDMLSFIGSFTAVVILFFLGMAFLYLASPQVLDRILHSLGLQKGIAIFSASNLFRALWKLGGIMALLGMITVGMVLTANWPHGWLIPSIQETIMAGVLFSVGCFGGRGKS